MVAWQSGIERMAAGSSPVDWGLCGFSCVHGDKIAVFDMYLDESGTHDSRGLVVGGYVGDANAWADFSAKWTALLHEYKLPYFRMKSFRERDSRAFRHLSRRQKHELLKALIGCIQDAALFGHAAMIRPADYIANTTREFRAVHGSSYTMCIVSCLAGAIGKLPKLTQSSERLGIFFESGHRNSVQALEVIKSYKEDMEAIDLEGVDVLIGNAIGPPSPEATKAQLCREAGYKIGAYGAASKRDMPPLQAADIIAHCFYAQSSRNDRFCTEVINLINSRIPHYVCPLEPDFIRMFVKATEQQKAIEQQTSRDAHELGKYLRGFGFQTSRTIVGLSVKGNPEEIWQRVRAWREGTIRRSK
jgi:hypothetical protein